MNVSVVVAGELARSPRMLNHARELARAGFDVTFIGYGGREFTVPRGVRVIAIPSYEEPDLPWSLRRAGVRMARVFAALFGAMRRSQPQVVLVQSPPAFPAVAARLLGVPVVLDWHNYGFTMLASRMGRASRRAERFERVLSRVARHHLCVSEGMQADLAQRFGVSARVLYDRPVESNRVKLPWMSNNNGPLVVVCPAGWTADEDMSLLFDALELLGPHRLEVHLTGDGPGRRELMPRMDALGIQTGYLPDSDYRALLARADLGLSLHRSSSGLDLAMKVVDLFAAGVPVCALDYGAVLREQIQAGETGFLFTGARQLADILAALQRDPAPLAAMRGHVGERWQSTWPEEWSRVAGPLLSAGPV